MDWGWWVEGAAPAELAGTVIIIVLIAYEIWIQGFLKERKRRQQLEKTFAMTVDDESTSKTVPVGLSDVPVNILIRTPTHFDKFNLRFVTTEGNNAPQDVVHVLNVQTRVPTHADWQAALSDGKGGREVSWNLRTPICRAGEALHMTVMVQATKPWRGFLSFRGYDAENNVRFVRLPFEAV